MISTSSPQNSAKRSRLSQQKIDGILQALEEGRPAAELAKENGVSLGSIYMWKAKFGRGHSNSELERLSLLNDQNKRLKCLVADLLLENQDLKELLTQSAES